MKLITITLVIIATSCFSQSSVNEYFQLLKQKKQTKNLPDSLFLEPNLEKTIKEILPFFKDTSLNIALNVVPIYVRACKAYSKSDIRKEAVKRLIKLSIDGIDCLNYLKGFYVNDFDDEAKEKIANHILSSKVNKDWMLISGFLKIEKLMAHYRKIAFSQQESPTYRWNTMLAMARMNDEGAINELIRVQNIQSFNDDFIYEILPDLLYTKNKKIYSALLEKTKQSDEKCDSPNPNSENSTPCICLALPAFSASIIDFPIKVNASGDIMERNCNLAIQKFNNWYGKSFEIEERVY